MPPALGVQSPNHWIANEFLGIFLSTVGQIGWDFPASALVMSEVRSLCVVGATPCIDGVPNLWTLPSSVQLLSRVRLFATPWTAARQASLSITNSRSLHKLMSIESVMPSNHLILCHSPSPPASNLSQHQSLFQ